MNCAEIFKVDKTRVEDEIDHIRSRLDAIDHQLGRIEYFLLIVIESCRPYHPIIANRKAELEQSNVTVGGWNDDE